MPGRRRDATGQGASERAALRTAPAAWWQPCASLGLLLLVLPTVVSVQYSTFQFAADANKTVTLPSGWHGRVSQGRIPWKGLPHRTADLAVLPGVVTPAEAAEILRLLPNQFDEDGDTVDNQATYEFYLEKSGDVHDALAANLGKRLDANPETLAQRLPVREALARVTGPILRERIVPFVNQRFADSCNGKCIVCFSFVRRYLPHERRGHAMHFDIQALVTAVVSLNSYGADFDGGLFVSAGGEHREYIGLRQGDAVFHQSDLLHGVNVPRGTRWSWVLWFKDAGDCEAADPTEWHRRPAEEGDAVAQFLHAHRMHQFGMPPPEAGAEAGATGRGSPALAAWRQQQRTAWLKRAAEGGFSRAQNELGDAYKSGAGVPVDLAMARHWFEAAARDGQEPDARYNLALLLLEEGGSVTRAVELFRTAAQQGSPDAMYNLGVAYHKGAGGLRRDLAQAARYLEMSGDTDGLYLAAQLHDQEGRPEETARLLLRAARAGHVTAGLVAAERHASDTAVQDAGREATEHTASRAEARKWLARAARQGDAYAQQLLVSQDVSTPHTEL